MLTLGKWYEVEKDYVDRVNKRLTDRAPTLLINDANFLPTIGKAENEGDYNARVPTIPGYGDYVLMDKKCKPIEGRSRIEVCDLFANGRDLIHVKLKTESATLSHLFSQGYVSAECFREHEVYRQFLSDQLVKAGRTPLKVANPNPADFRVVYAITAPPAKKLPDQLPFFSKVNLLHHLTSVERMGFETGLRHIHIL